jgi:hypothetical protein
LFRKFRFKSNPTGDLHIGVVAQELETVSPKLVTEVATSSDDLTSTETVTQDQVEPSKTVQTLSYAELRDRLPKEITDDIVQLIAASERALQDFAYIRTQQDVNDFNAKYGVNLVLPASAT